MRRVLGINGDVGSGKDTLFSLLPPGAHRLAFGDALKEEVAEFLGAHDVAYAIRFLIAHACDLETLRAILEETWATPINGHAYAFLQTVVANEGARNVVDRFVSKLAPLDAVRELHRHVPPMVLVGKMHDRSQKERFRSLMRWWGTEYRRVRFRDDYWTRKVGERIATTPEDALVAVTDCRYPNEFDFVRFEHDGLVVRIEREGTQGTRTHTSDLSYRGYEFDRIVRNDGTIGDLSDEVSSLLYLLDLDAVDKMERRKQKEHWLGPRRCNPPTDFVRPAGQIGPLRDEPRVYEHPPRHYTVAYGSLDANEIEEAKRLYRETHPS